MNEKAQCAPSGLLRASAAALMVVAASHAVADTVITDATPTWGNSIEGRFDDVRVGYPTREGAAIGGVSYWCTQNIAAGYVGACTYGGLDAENWASVITNQGTFRIVSIYQYWVCPVGVQQLITDGKHVCLNYNAPPPPPPPPPIPVVIDPGHGFLCRAKGLPPGTVGVTDFPASDPPAGLLQEDAIAFAIALEVQRQMSPATYTVVLTKASVNDCPKYLERGRVVRHAEAQAFVSVHTNAPLAVLGVPVPAAHGTSVAYNTGNTGSSSLADVMSRSVSASLGTNNRGAYVDNGLHVLKLENTPVRAVLVETARLSGPDEQILHSAGSASRAAGGIKAALNAFFGR